MIPPDALGITRIQDLSQQDMEKVRGVALLELTVTFDDHDIPLRSRRQTRIKNYPGGCVRCVRCVGGIMLGLRHLFTENVLYAIIISALS